MGNKQEFFTTLHKKTARDYAGRMADEKVACAQVARRFDEQFWDGDRKFGYGGYKYDGRWSVVAEHLVSTYGLTNESSVLDVGCGKGFLLHEIKKILPGITVKGFDISEYAIENGKEEVKDNLFIHRAEQVPYPFKDKEFDLVISLNTLHNLYVFDLKKALQEMERVAKNGYIVVESYRNVEELYNVQCWALTCEAFFTPEEWVWLFKEFGYSGDYEFIYFE